MPNEEIIPEDPFLKAEKLSDFNRLYEDLKKHEYNPTPTMNARLAELCLGNNPSEIANKFGIEESTVSVSLSEYLKLSTESLLQEKNIQLGRNIAWGDFKKIFQKAGYNLEPIASRYEIIEKLGEGEFSETYKAKDKDFPGEPFRVFKKLKNPAGNRGIELFEREAKVLADLGKHDRIPLLYDYCSEQDKYHLVLEYIEGNSLTSELGSAKNREEANLAGNKWEEAKVIALLREILEILQYVHQKKVIHRNIHPKNLVRRHNDGKIVLINFGTVKQISAQLVNRQDAETSTICIGKNGYAPLEQLHDGKPQLCSDIYAVGIIGIQALTGIDPTDLRRDQQNEISWRNRAEVSNPFATVLEKMVRRNYQQRYQSATEAWQALQNLGN